MDTLVSMRTFRSVAEQLSFVAASERMGLSPAMTSKHVMNLEKRLGVRLLNRNSRSVSLTEAGRTYLNQLTQSLDALDEVEATITSASREPQGLLRISAPVWIANSMFAKTLTEFRQRYPGVSLELDLTGRLVNLIDEGYDLALRMSPTPGDQYIVRKLTEVQFEWVASPDYMERSGRPETLQSLRDFDLLWYSEISPENIWPSGRGKGSNKTPVKPVLTSGNESLLHHAALQGMGIATLPLWMIKEDLASGRLISVFDSVEKFCSPLLGVYSSRKYLSSKVRTFLEFVSSDKSLQAVK